MTRRLRMNFLLGCAVVAGMYAPGAWRSVYATPIVHAGATMGAVEQGAAFHDGTEAGLNELERNEDTTR